MKHPTDWKPMGGILLAATLTPALCRPATADPVYRIEPIIRLGERIGESTLRLRGDFFEILKLTNDGRLTFTAVDRGNGQKTLLQAANGTVDPIVVPGEDGPTGKWPAGTTLSGASDAAGNVVFSAFAGQSVPALGTFRWDAGSRKLTPLLLKGQSHSTVGTVADPGGLLPTSNSAGEVVLPAGIQGEDGILRYGLLHRDRQERLRVIALSDQRLAGGSRIEIDRLSGPAISNSGAVTFHARRPGDPADRYSLYRWHEGTITPIALAGSALPGGGTLGSAQRGDEGGGAPGAPRIPFLARRDGAEWWEQSACVWEAGTVTLVAQVGRSAPGGGQIDRVGGVFATPLSADLLVEARLKGDTHPYALYRFAAGQLLPAVIPKQAMPGGGAFQQLWGGISEADAQGRRAFLALLTNGVTAAYLLALDGTLSLVAKSGTTTSAGRITAVEGAFGVGLNDRGQVALGVRLAGGPPTMALLTPVQP